MQVLAALIGSIGTNFTVFSALYTVAIAVLFGANVAMMAYYFRLRRQFVRQAGQAGAAASLGGLTSGLFGIGCAACGTFVLGPVLSFVGASGLIALLPFGGEEFGILGAGMLGFSLFLIAKKIHCAKRMTRHHLAKRLRHFASPPCVSRQTTGSSPPWNRNAAPGATKPIMEPIPLPLKAA